MNRQPLDSTLIIEPEFELWQDDISSGQLNELYARMAVGGLLWQSVFAVLALMSFVVVVMMYSIWHWIGMGVFAILGVLLGYGAFLPYRHAKAEVGIYYDLIEAGEELWLLSDYPLSGFFHYMTMAEWLIFILMVMANWVSILFLIIAFENNHQATFLAFLLLFFVSMAIIGFVIFYAHAKKDYYLSE